MRRKSAIVLVSAALLAFAGGLGYEVLSGQSPLLIPQQFSHQITNQIIDAISSSQAEVRTVPSAFGGKDGATKQSDEMSAESGAGGTKGESAAVKEPGTVVTGTEADEETRTHLPDKETIDDLKSRREEIEKRAHDLDAREAELKTKEAALDEEFKKIEQVRDDISKIDSSRKKENEEKIVKIIETFEAMNPKAVSLLLSTMDESLAVASMSKMSTQKLSKVMNVMETAKSSRLTELLAGVIKARSTPRKNESATPSIDAGSITPISTKGGEKNDGKNEQRANSDSASQSPTQGQPAGQKATSAQR